MTMCANDTVVGSDELYWADGNAAPPVLLIDEATEAITEALHRMRSESMLEQRDVAAASVGLGDLFGGLSQLVELLTTAVNQDSQPDALDRERLTERLGALRVMMLLAQRGAEKLQYGSAEINTTNNVEPFSNCTPLRTLRRGSSNRPPTNREARVG